MASIPPNFLGSILQTQGAKARAAADRDREQVTNGERTTFAERLSDVIEQTDRDGQVYSDAEGNGGGQGRPSESAPETPPADESPEQAPGGLDLQA
jgi:hypothetical protein